MKKVFESQEEMMVVTNRFVWLVNFDCGGAISSVNRMPKGGLNPSIPSNPYVPMAWGMAKPLLTEVCRYRYRMPNWENFFPMLWSWRHSI